MVAFGDFRGLQCRLVIYLADGGNHYSSAAGVNLIHLGKFFYIHLAHFNGKPHVDSHLPETLVGNGRENAVRIGGNVTIAFNTEEVGGAEFFDMGMGGSVQEKQLPVALLAGYVVSMKTLRIIGA